MADAPLVSEDNSTPSPLAIKHEREISALSAQYRGLHEEMGGHTQWLQKIERTLENFADEVRGMFGRMSQRNPAVYIGVGALLFSIVGMASALTIFTINAQITPLREALVIHDKQIEKSEERERKDFEMIIRNDERIRHMQKQEP